jgi:hypothetical protein
MPRRVVDRTRQPVDVTVAMNTGLLIAGERQHTIPDAFDAIQIVGRQIITLSRTVQHVRDSAKAL